MRITILLLLLCSNYIVKSQCNSCTITISTSTNTNYSLGNGQKLCINGGTYTGNIDFNGGSLCVGPAAIFRAANLNFNGTGIIDNYGDWLMTGGFNLATGVTINNYKRMDIGGNINFNGAGVITNAFPQTLILRQQVSIGNSGSITNNGFLFANAGLTTQSGGTYINATNSKTYINGDFNVGGTNSNLGYIRIKGNVNINGANVSNQCSYLAERDVNINGGTFTNAGFILTVNTTGTEIFRLNGGATLVGSTTFAVVAAPNFANSGTVTGRGKYKIKTSTTNQGAFGNDALGITFFDESQTGSQMFDAQSPSPHSSVNRNPVLNYDSNYVKQVCSSNAALLANKFIMLNAITKNTGPEIIWEIADNNSNKKYDVEVSNGYEYVTVGTTINTLTATNTNSYTQRVTANNFTHYRVKATTLTDNIYYSETKRYAGQNGMNIFIVTNNKELVLDRAVNEKATIQVYNLQGVQLHKANIQLGNTYTYPIPTTLLQQQQCILSVSTPTRKQVQKIVLSN